MSTQEHAQPARKVVDELQEMLDMFPDFPWLSFKTADVRGLVEYVRLREGLDKSRDYHHSVALVKKLKETRRALGLGGE